MGREKQQPLLADGGSDYKNFDEEGDGGIPMTEKIDITDMRGLSSAEANARLAKYGYNEIKEEKKPVWIMLMEIFWGWSFIPLCGIKIGPIPKPIPAMMWVAIIVSLAILDWPDMGVIAGLHLLNGIIAFYENRKAGDAVAALRAALAPRCRVKRDGKFEIVDARILVPGDVVMVKLGDVLPADVVLCEEHGQSLDVDQSSLTGESLPVTKYPGDTAYSGTTVKRGEMECIVASTGERTEFGKTAKLIQSVKSEGKFQMVLFRIAKVIMGVAIIMVVILFIYGFASAPTIGTTVSAYRSRIVQRCLVLLVASIPIAMPVVCTATMAVGARRLAKANAICTRISAIEELAGMTVLCSDKTGTLTKNELTLYDPWTLGGISGEELIFYAVMASKEVDPDAIDLAIRKNCKRLDEASRFRQVNFIPFDPIIKRTQATVVGPDGREFMVSKGAPQVILKLIEENKDVVGPQVDQVVTDFAGRGLRPLGVARTDENGKWRYLGIISLFDPPRDDTKSVIERALALGSDVKMITGDHLLIARETCRQLGMGANIMGHHALEKTHDELIALVDEADGFAEVFPDQKFKIVALFQEKGHITGMTGDGVNDAPALKKADIGFAVHGATPAAQGAASVVLLTPGLSAIIDAIVRSRKIFQRMKNYCIYRVNLSFMLLGFFFVTILAFNFELPAIVIVLMALLNDFTIMTIAYDKVQPSNRPEGWRVLEVCSVAIVLGVVGVIGTVVLYLLVTQGFVMPELQYDKGSVKTMIFLCLSLQAELSVFAARTDGVVFSRRPGFALLAALLFEMAFSTIISAYWPSALDPAAPITSCGAAGYVASSCFCPNLADESALYPNCIDQKIFKNYNQPMLQLPWQAVGIVWGYCLAVLIVQEFSKAVAYYFLSGSRRDLKDELTKQQAAARRKLTTKERARSHAPRR